MSTEGVQLDRRRITLVVAVVSVGLSAVLAYLLFAPAPRETPPRGEGLPAVAEVERLEESLLEERQPPPRRPRPSRRLGWEDDTATSGPGLDELLSRPAPEPTPPPWAQTTPAPTVDPWEQEADQAYRQALRGRLRLDGRRDGRQAGSARPSAGPSAASSELASLEAVLGLVGAPTEPAPSPSTASGPASARAPERSEAVRAQPRPATPEGLVVPRGTVLQATLTSGVQSDLGGQVAARVTRDVYAEGLRRVAIPAGSVLLGDYVEDLVIGQERLVVVWDALRFPDGRRFDVEALAGTDRQGRAGLADRVDHHTWSTVGRAALVGLVGAAFQLGQPVDERGDGRLSEREVAAGAVSRELERATGELLRGWAGRRPTIELRPGLGIQVVAREDLIFP